MLMQGSSVIWKCWTHVLTVSIWLLKINYFVLWVSLSPIIHHPGFHLHQQYSTSF
jgi:hypothetical protein